MTTITDQISKVDRKIEQVEQQIREVEQTLKEDLSQIDTACYRNQKQQLCTKKQQLRNEKNKLLDIQLVLIQQNQLRDEKTPDPKEEWETINHPLPSTLALAPGTVVEGWRKEITTDCWDFSAENIRDLQRKFHTLPPPLEPQNWIGRDQAEAQVHRIASQNFIERRSSDHASFSYLVASGHVRSGKTRTGIEAPRIVKKFCASLADHRLADEPVYLKIDFLNSAKYNPQFDVPDLSYSEALGARLMSAFYQGVGLKKVRADIPDLIVPIVIHMDEHGEFISNRNKKQDDKSGKEYFLEMLKLVGSAATSSEGLLSSLHKAGHYFLVPITTGTSHSSANISEICTYSVASVKLPVLTFEQRKVLARLCFEARGSLETHQIEAVLEQFLFRIALGDTGGLPGLVYFLCSYDFSGRDMSPEVTNQTVLMTEYVVPGSLTRYATIDDLQNASPCSNYRVKDYTVQDALDGGTIFLRPSLEGGLESDHKEIGLASALLAKFNGGNGLFNSILTQAISCSQNWTWQQFEIAHLCYLAATMAASIKQQERFQIISLGTFLRNARPTDSALLSDRMQLPEGFQGATLREDPNQCIPRTNAKQGSQITVDIDDSEYVHLAKDGTPIIDGYLNLTFQAPAGAGVASKTVFVQYKHSGLESQTSPVHVSSMNIEVRKLDARLRKNGWQENRGWIFLWVTNREIVSDMDPDPRLLWVDKSTLADHAPLLGTRGLAPLEELRNGE
ncbi:MAG: hypothetical protein SGBAC_013293 [Bacillariaceae sp.]